MKFEIKKVRKAFMNTKNYLRLTLLSILVGAPLAVASEIEPTNPLATAIGSGITEAVHEKLASTAADSKEEKTKPKLTAYVASSSEMAAQFAQFGPVFLNGDLFNPKGLCTREKAEDAAETTAQITFADFVEKHINQFDLTVTALDEETRAQIEQGMVTETPCFTLSLLDEETKKELMAKIAAHSAVAAQESTDVSVAAITSISASSESPVDAQPENQLTTETSEVAEEIAPVNADVEAHEDQDDQENRNNERQD